MARLCSQKATLQTGLCRLARVIRSSLPRVTKQVIGPQIPRSGLEHLDGETWDVVERMKLNVEFRKISSTCVLPSNLSLNQTHWDDCHCHGRCQGSVHARKCSPPTIASCACSELTIPADQRTPLPGHKDDWRRIYRRSSHPQRFYNFSNVRLVSSPIEVQRADPPPSSRCPRMWQVRQAGPTAFRAHWDSLLNAGSRSCSSRC